MLLPRQQTLDRADGQATFLNCETTPAHDEVGIRTAPCTHRRAHILWTSPTGSTTDQMSRQSPLPQALAVSTGAASAYSTAPSMPMLYPCIRAIANAVSPVFS